MRVNRFVISLLCAGMFSSTSFGQAQHRMVGLVEGPKGLPIVGADVVPRSAAGMAPLAVTDSAGRFEFLASANEVRVLIRKIGFQPMDTVLKLNSGSSTPVRIRLATVQTLPSLVVRSPLQKPARYAATTKFDLFYERRARGMGNFFTREEIEAKGHTSPVDLLRAIPGATVVRQHGNALQLKFARCSMSNLSPSDGGRTIGTRARQERGSQIAVYVNGMEIDRVYAMEYLDELTANDVEAIEVYRGPSMLPQEALGNACAAIFIWTRYSVGSVLNDSVP